MKVKVSTSYSKFSLLPMNREIMSRHAAKMAESIKAMGVIRPVVCCKTNVIEGVNKLYVLDGQHLLTGLERLDMDVPYIVIEVTDALDIVKKMGMLNSSSKSWNLMNYVNAYKMYIPDYMEIFRLKNLYDIDINMLSSICSLNSSYDSSGGSSMLKEGNFKMINPNPEAMCKSLTELFDVIPGMDHGLKRKLLRARLNVGNKYNHARTISNMKIHKAHLEVMGSDVKGVEYLQKNIFI